MSKWNLFIIGTFVGSLQATLVVNWMKWDQRYTLKDVRYFETLACLDGVASQDIKFCEFYDDSKED